MVERGRMKFDSSFKEELKKEIKQEILEELRNPRSSFEKTQKLEISDTSKIMKASEKPRFQKEEEIYYPEEQESSEKKPKKPIKLLIALVLIVLLLDFAIVTFYYNPNFFKTSGFIIRTNNSNEVSGDCSDGTAENTCSRTKPYYCSEGKLIEAGYTCGCPIGFERSFQSCVESS